MAWHRRKRMPQKTRQSLPPKIETFIAGYLEDRRSQKYSGPSGILVRRIAETFKKDTFLLQALDHGDVIAATLFLRHGSSATYYLSWTTSLGRERNAAHLLLWQGLLQLRETGVKWLDLGGMDARAPGLARFKPGLGADATSPIAGRGSDPGIPPCGRCSPWGVRSSGCDDKLVTLEDANILVQG